MEIVIYKDKDGSVPFIDWLNNVSRQDPRIPAKIKATLQILNEHGFRLRRPVADYLRDDIYELRIHFGRVNYRIFYSFYDNKIVLLNACVKEAKVPESEINKAIGMLELYKSDPLRYKHGI